MCISTASTDAVALCAVHTIRPRTGDIVIHRQVHSPAVYVLSVLDGPPQLVYKRYEAALTHATACALEEFVDAWYTTDEHAFECVAAHRPTS